MREWKKIMSMGEEWKKKVEILGYNQGGPCSTQGI